MDYSVQIQEAAERLLFWALEEEHVKLVEDATKIYLKGSESDKDMQGFNDWFIHDYRTQDGKSLVKLYLETETVTDEEKDVFKSIETSVYSAFERIGVQDKMLVKDIFTKLDYVFDEEFGNASVMLMRIYKIGSKHIVTEPPEHMPDQYKPVLIKGMLEKYNEYCRLFMPMEMSDFIKKYSQVLYRFLNVIDNTATEHALDEDEYVVYQSLYVVKDLKEIYKRFKEAKHMELALDDEAGSVFKLKNNQTQEVISEIVLADDKVEIECVSSDLLEDAKAYVERILDDIGAHLRDEIVNIDDLIG